MRSPQTAIGLVLIGTLALVGAATAHDEAADPSIHGRNYTSHRQPGNHAFETPGGFHGHPRYGFEVGAHWDRTWPPALPLYGGTGGFGPWGYGNAPWPLGNLDIEVQAE